jgi:NADP-dependent 3-hydroxy acid dehydrogenase YdfG
MIDVNLKGVLYGIAAALPQSAVVDAPTNLCFQLSPSG